MMHEKERLFDNLQKLIKGIQVLGIPVLWVEQNPVGLGPTIPEVADLLPDSTPISKMSFSSCRNDRFLQALKNLDRKPGPDCRYRKPTSASIRRPPI